MPFKESKTWTCIFCRVNSELSRLENVDATWKLWESQAEELTKILRQDGDTLKVLDEAIQTGTMTDSATASMQGVARLLNDKRKTQPGKKLLLQHTKTQVRERPPRRPPSFYVTFFVSYICLINLFVFNAQVLDVYLSFTQHRLVLP